MRRTLQTLVSGTLCIALCVMQSAEAAGTAAGTSIQAAARASYSIGGTTLTTVSNTARVVVVEMIDGVVTAVSEPLVVVAGATQRALLFTVTNAGNGSETFSLSGSSAVPGNDFDPVAAAPFIYFDSDGDGGLSVDDTPYVPGRNDPVLAVDASVRVLMVSNIPAGIADGRVGRIRLAAMSQTGVAAPGTVFPGRGDAGVDAVLGTSGGGSDAVGEYVIAGIELSAVKSQVVLDPSGGSRPVSGARITYRIVVAATGSGTAGAAVLTDIVPEHTTYVPGSLKLDGTVLSDAADTDAGQFVALPAPAVQVDFGDLTQAIGPRTAEFVVTIN